MLLRQLLYSVIFYLFLRKLAIKRVPNFDHAFRRVEFVVLSQVSAPFVIIWILLSGRRWESVRFVPWLLEHLYGTSLQFQGRIPTDRNCIIICNHQSGLDIWPLLQFTPTYATVIAKSSLRYMLGLLSIVLQQLRLTFIDRRQRDKCFAILDKVKVRLGNDKERFGVVVFPEGTRGNGTDLLPFKLSAFHMAVSTGVPIVPVVIGSHLKYAGKSTFPISILDPIVIEKEIEPERITEKAREWSNTSRALMQAEFTRINNAADIIL